MRFYEQGTTAAYDAFVHLHPLGYTLAFAESYTGGLLAALFSEVPGCSQVFYGGVCAYSDESKTRVLGLDPSLLADYGAVSSEVALAMAHAASRLFGSSLGIATTGNAGPSAGDSRHAVGKVWWAVVGTNQRGLPFERSFTAQGQSSRREIRFASALEIFRYLKDL